MAEQNVDNCICRLFEDVWNRGQTELIDEICSSNFICNFGTEASRNRDQLRRDIAQWLEAFPDIQHEIVDTVVQNDKTAIRWQGHGTHQAAFMGIPATGNAFEYSGITIFRTSGNQISEVWVYADVARLMSDLRAAHEAQEKAKAPAPQFSDDLTGPAAKIYAEVLRIRPIVPAKQMIAAALRRDFVPVDKPLQLIIPQEIMDEVRVSEIRTPGPGGSVRSLVYRPLTGESMMPVLVYCHGGGWCMGDPEESDLVCRKLSHRSGVTVVSIDYRLAPEFPYPHGLEDFVSVYEWVREHAANELDADQRRVAVGGDSSGGNLAAALPLWVRDKGGLVPDATVLLCPLTDFVAESYDSFKKVGPNSLIYDAAFLGYVRSNYVPFAEQWTTPYVSPMYGDLIGFPPTMIIAAGYDILFDDNKRFAEKLREAGNTRVELLIHESMPHAYYYLLGLSKEEDEAYQAMAAFLKEVLV
jgi:acetyl esterase